MFEYMQILGQELYKIIMEQKEEINLLKEILVRNGIVWWHHLIEHQESSTDFQYRPNRTNIDGVMENYNFNQ